MVSLHETFNKNQVEELLAELTDAAYRVTLRHQSRVDRSTVGAQVDHEGFINVELALWTALREVLERKTRPSEEAA